MAVPVQEFQIGQKVRVRGQKTFVIRAIYYSSAGDLIYFCRGYHKSMIAATPGLCVHEADGTVRRPWSREL